MDARASRDGITLEKNVTKSISRQFHLLFFSLFESCSSLNNSSVFRFEFLSTEKRKSIFYINKKKKHDLNNES